MFHNLTPVSGGIGMKLLQKMGWKPGQVIGKRGEGYAEPITLTVKIDRKGLSAGKEKAAKKSTPAVLDLQGTNIIVLIVINNTTCTLSLFWYTRFSSVVAYTVQVMALLRL